MSKELLKALDGLPDVRVATLRALLQGMPAPPLPAFVLATPSPGPFVLLSLVVNRVPVAANVPNGGRNAIMVPLPLLGPRPWTFWWAALPGANLTALGAFYFDGSVLKLGQKVPAAAGAVWSGQVVVP